MKIDMDGLDKLNVWRDASGQRCTRPGLRRLYAPPAGRLLVGGFSIPNSMLREMWHYTWDVSSTAGAPKDLRLRILDENFIVFQEYAYNLDIVPRGLSYVRILQQLLLCGIGIPTLWGLEGSGVQPAIAQASISGSDVIDVPSGVACTWQGRPVIVNGTTANIGDPVNVQGGDLRSFIGDNQSMIPGGIYGVHHAGGMLVMVTSAGVFGLDDAAAAVGVVGTSGADWRTLSHRETHDYESSCVVSERLFVLTQAGLAVADTEGGQELLLSQQPMPRLLAPRIWSSDFRSNARLYAGDIGPIVALPGQDACWMSDGRNGLQSWWTSDVDGGSWNVVGTLRDRDGVPLLLTESGALRMEGDFDGGTAIGSAILSQPRAVLSGRIDPGDSDNVLIDGIRVRGALGGSGGGLLHAAVRGHGHSLVAARDLEGLMIDVDAWGASGKRWTNTPIASVRFPFGSNDARPTRDPTFEVGIDNCSVRLDDPDVSISQSGTDRPQRTG